MKKFLKPILSIALAFMLLASIFCINIFAAGTIIAFSNKSVVVGDTMVVTVTLNAGEAMYGVGCVINYDSAKFEYVSGASTGGAGSLQIIESPSGETKVSYSITFKALAAGSATFSVLDCRYESLTESKSLTGASASATVTDASLSGNANLSALSLSAGSLSPKFSANRTTYNVTVSNSVTDISVYATAADSGASVKVPASTKLNIGKNTITVTVTAPNGTQKTYTINVTRSETEVTDEEPEEETPVESTDIKVTVDGVEYIVAEDISAVTMLTGFTASTVTFKEKEITVAVDAEGNFTLYYLKAADSDALVPYTYDKEEDIFEKLAYLTRNEKNYIISEIPDDKTYPDGYYITNVTVDSMAIKCLADAKTSLSDFSYIYCYNGSEFGFYRYDNKEGTLQRFPELLLEDADNTLNIDKEPSDNLISRFGTLSSNAKIIVIAFVFVLLCAIALVVLLIIKYTRRNIDDDFEFVEEDDDFDNIEVTNGNELNSEETEEVAGE